MSTKAKRLIPRSLLGVAGFALLLVSLPPAFAATTITAKPVVTGLNFPGTLAVAPDGRIFYGETYSGRIYIYNPVTKTQKLFFRISGIGATVSPGREPSLLHGGDQGLYGLTLHPNYPSTPYVYATASRVFSGDVHKHQVLRLTDSGGSGTGLKVLTSQLSGIEHFGGRLLFGPDGMLYVVIGEGGNPANAQDLSSSNNYGKVLRMTGSGAIPADNPFPNSRIFAYGIRNSIGFDFDPSSGRLWLVDNGPQCNDEVNIILKGKNYGWGPLSGAPDACGTPPKMEDTNRDGPSPELPRVVYNPSIGPTGAAFCSDCNLGPESAGRFFFADWNTGQVRRLTLNSTRWDVESQDVAYDHPTGILALEEARGAIYFSDQAGIYTLASGDSTGGTKDVSVYNYYFSPKAPLVPQGYAVRWTFKQGTHTATDASGMGYFNSGLKSVGETYSHTFTAAGRYKYRSTASGDPKTMVGIIKVPLKVSPLSGGTSTTFTVTWASAAPASSYFSHVAYRYKPCAKSQSCTWTAWKNWKTGQTSATSAGFSPTNGKGTYQLRARFGRQVTSSTKKFSLWSVPVTVSVT